MDSSKFPLLPLFSPDVYEILDSFSYNVGIWVNLAGVREHKTIILFFIHDFLAEVPGDVDLDRPVV
jgi:hypothetical protein